MLIFSHRDSFNGSRFRILELDQAVERRAHLHVLAILKETHITLLVRKRSHVRAILTVTNVGRGTVLQRDLHGACAQLDAAARFCSKFLKFAFFVDFGFVEF